MSDQPVDIDSELPNWAYYIMYAMIFFNTSLAFYFIYLIIF